MSTRPTSEPDRPPYDPVFLHARREAWVIFFIWLAALLWCVPYSYLFGYRREEQAVVETIWGIPSWLFWGIAMPWLVSNVITIWFCFFYMQDDPLGAAPEQDSSSDESSHGEGNAA